ncbi:DUF2849 domain-containing protein [Erythrobacter sp. EC-HK427]|uniref:DUF2849 domain-containing protein n=1 Tax=Erythrobacter sp. EC-HK427 TaxID=2038396 RepID=UPI00125250C0|nr:DUF2849 domain-containing protein [Erythrobacter sp. EC-HK427]VVS97295.1 conserved hypothetical protein [Erythrobacter sp. EC-HK427]
MKILTGNDLKTGAVVWWNGQGWSLHIADAVDAGEHAADILAAEESARRVNASYAIDAELTDDGPRPAHIKDRVRALGPTVRPDLGYKAAAERGWDWVI